MNPLVPHPSEYASVEFDASVTTTVSAKSPTPTFIALPEIPTPPREPPLQTPEPVEQGIIVPTESTYAPPSPPPIIHSAEEISIPIPQEIEGPDQKTIIETLKKSPEYITINDDSDLDASGESDYDDAPGLLVQRPEQGVGNVGDEHSGVEEKYTPEAEVDQLMDEDDSSTPQDLVAEDVAAREMIVKVEDSGLKLGFDAQEDVVGAAPAADLATPLTPVFEASTLDAVIEGISDEAEEVKEIYQDDAQALGSVKLTVEEISSQPPSPEAKELEQFVPVLEENSPVPDVHFPLPLDEQDQVPEQQPSPIPEEQSLINAEEQHSTVAEEHLLEVVVGQPDEHLPSPVEEQIPAATGNLEEPHNEDFYRRSLSLGSTVHLEGDHVTQEWRALESASPDYEGEKGEEDNSGHLAIIEDSGDGSMREALGVPSDDRQENDIEIEASTIFVRIFSRER
jgi:hypothetical protein